MPLYLLADLLVNGGETSLLAHGELERRRFLFDQEAARAQQSAAISQADAADAAKETALYTRKNARYMLWSVVVLAIGSAVTASFSAWDHFFPHPQTCIVDVQTD